MVDRKQRARHKNCQEIEIYTGGQKCSKACKLISGVKSGERNKATDVILLREWEEYYKNLDRTEITV